MIKHYRLLLLSLLGLLATSAAHAEQFSALLFSKTAGWHHESILEGVKAIRDLGQLHDFTVFWTEDAARVFKDEELKKYKVVIFLSTTGDILNDEQQAAFERYIKAGGGFVGIHAAADTEYGWPWYTKMVGHMFHIHPAVQTATIKVEDANFPGMDRFPKRFLATEEWYEFDASRSTSCTTCSAWMRRRTSRTRNGARRKARAWAACIRSRGTRNTTAVARSTRRWVICRRLTVTRASCTTSTAESTGRRRATDSRRSNWWRHG